MTIHLVSTRRARNTQARDLASPPRTQTRKAAPDEQETPKRGIWHRPQKRQGSTVGWPNGYRGQRNGNLY